MRKNFHSGYAGLIVIILSVAIMVLLYVKFYFTPRDMSQTPEAIFQPQTASGTAPVTQYEALHADVDAAKAVQEKLNERNRAINNTLGE